MGQKKLLHSWNLTVHHWFTKTHYLTRELIEFIQHSHILCDPNVCSNVPSGLSDCGLSIKVLCAFLISSMRVICLAQLILRDLMTFTILDEEL